MALEDVNIEKITLVDAVRINVETEWITVVRLDDESIMGEHAFEIGHKFVFVEHVWYGTAWDSVFCRYDHLFHVCYDFRVAYRPNFAQEAVVFITF